MQVQRLSCFLPPFDHMVIISLDGLTGTGRENQLFQRVTSFFLPPSELEREEGAVGQVLVEVCGHHLHPALRHLPLRPDLLGR